jgi:hypothetical protein
MNLCTVQDPSRPELLIDSDMVGRDESDSNTFDILIAHHSGTCGNHGNCEELFGMLQSNCSSSDSSIYNSGIRKTWSGTRPSVSGLAFSAI